MSPIAELIFTVVFSCILIVGPIFLFVVSWVCFFQSLKEKQKADIAVAIVLILLSSLFLRLPMSWLSFDPIKHIKCPTCNKEIK